MDEKDPTRELVVVEAKRYKKVKKALAKSEERYRQLFENIPIGIYRTTPDGCIVDANPALIKMLGYGSFAELAKNNIVLDEAHASYSRQEFIERLERDGEIKGLEALWKRRDGSQLAIRENTKLIRGEKGEVFFEGTIEDISQRSMVEARLHAYQEQLRALSSEMTLIEEKERRRIASELHDQIGQNLALCKLKIAALEKDAAEGDLKTDLSTVRRLLEGSIKDARSLIFDLSPPVLYELGFQAALEWLAECIGERYGVPVEFEDRSDGQVFTADQEVILFRVVRELLVNMGKHSRASQAKVILSLEGQTLKIQVNDDGVGFDATSIYDAKNLRCCFGFFTMRERLNYLGGTLNVRSRAGHGTQIVLSVPLSAMDSP